MLQNEIGSLTFLRESHSDNDFLVDTGVAVSVFPHRHPTVSSLKKADGEPIHSWGTVTKDLFFGSKIFLMSLPPLLSPF
jgi:hypothetical protein